MTSRHLDEALLAELALGTIDERERSARTEHVAGCEPCRNALDALHRALAWLGSTASPAAPPASLRARVLASAAAPGRQALADLFARTFDLGLPEARRVLELADEAFRWSPGPITGMSRLPFDPGPRLAGARAELLRLGAGMSFPRHGHRGRETVVVLEGGFTGDDGVHHAEGERLETPTGAIHAFRSDEAGCLVASLLLGELVFEG
jgi:putative transcriptional regulator